MNLAKDFSDFIFLLNSHKVEYMVVGGYALAFHGEPRTTGDMDIWIECTPVNAKKMVLVLKEFGVGSLGFKAADFLEPGIITQIGQPPLRIDILNEIDGVRYSEAKKDKEFFKSAELLVPFISLINFIKNKEAAGRKKDLEDVRRLKPQSKKRK
jgi:hypothetical protein